MEIHCYYSQGIRDALAKVNERYAGNIKFKRFDTLGAMKNGLGRFRVTLTVVDSHGPGASYDQYKGRHISAACWHVHGYFMNALPQGTVIITTAGREKSVKHPGDTWQDWQAGSMMYPIMMSERCRCDD
jgi:hypothetical protein